MLAMSAVIPRATLSPPDGRPNWRGEGALPLLYLGWGQRDFARFPLPVHFGMGSNHYLLVKGSVEVTVGGQRVRVEAPVAMVFDPDTPFGIRQSEAGEVEILVWIWQGRPALPEISTTPGGWRSIPLTQESMEIFLELHDRCRSEVVRADSHVPETLQALRSLLEVGLARAVQPSGTADDVRWKLAADWIARNLHSQCPVPALCEYLGMSASGLHRFFRKHCGQSPGAHVRQCKLAEARRLVEKEGWLVKSAAYHLGYKHPNDLSRALAQFRVAVSSQ